MRTTLIFITAIATAAVLSGCSVLGVGTVEDIQFTAGECLSVADTDPETNMPASVECGDPHDAEVYYTEELSDDELPADVATQADEICYTQYEGFVGAAAEVSEYTYGFYYPDYNTWEHGDRQVACVIQGWRGEEFTGSLEGAEL